MRLYRESTDPAGSLPRANIDLEARAAIELDDSPFIVHPVLNDDFLDIRQTEIIHHAHYNVNTRTKLEEFQF